MVSGSTRRCIPPDLENTDSSDVSETMSFDVVDKLRLLLRQSTPVLPLAEQPKTTTMPFGTEGQKSMESEMNGHHESNIHSEPTGITEMNWSQSSQQDNEKIREPFEENMGSELTGHPESSLDSEKETEETESEDERSKYLDELFEKIRTKERMTMIAKMIEKIRPEDMTIITTGVYCIGPITSVAICSYICHPVDEHELRAERIKDEHELRAERIKDEILREHELKSERIKLHIIYAKLYNSVSRFLCGASKRITHVSQLACKHSHSQTFSGRHINCSSSQGKRISYEHSQTFSDIAADPLTNSVDIDCVCAAAA